MAGSKGAEVYGFFKSFLVYYGKPGRILRMKQLYRQFIRRGTLCFDIGAHVGNRIQVWRKLGGVVVACEPHPRCFHFLKKIYGKKKDVHLLHCAVSDRSGAKLLHICSSSPTLSTISESWIETVKKAEIFSKITWNRMVSVPGITLEDLINRFGSPGFIKIDTEGSEHAVLKGLHHRVPALSFEFLPASIGVAAGCVAELARLGDYRFNISPVETMKFQWREWKSGEAVLAFFSGLSPESRSGDVYARLDA